MLGREKRHERKLEEHGGKTAWATVLDVQKWQSSGGMNVSPGAPNSLKIHCKLKLRVEPEGTPPFEAEAHHVFTQQAPWEGCSVAVIYDPSKPSDLVIDESQGFGRGGAGLAGFAGGDAPASVPFAAPEHEDGHRHASRAQLVILAGAIAGQLRPAARAGC